MRVRTPQGRCHFGIARQDITPPVGIYHRMWGAAAHDRAEGVHRPLLATAMVFQPWDGGDRTSDRLQIVVALDHCLLHQAEATAIVEAISQRTATPAESVLLVFSHTHAAGLLGSDRQAMPGGELIPDYMAKLNDRLAALVADALEKVGPATLTTDQGVCGLAGHRDLFDEEEQMFVCGWNPSTPADQTVAVVRVTDDAGQVLAVMVHYACHPTTLAWDNRLISPDYPGAMRELIEQTIAAPCVFLQGASGDLGPRVGFVGDTEVADRNGRQLGHAALSVLEGMGPPGTHFQYAGPVVSGATIGTWKYEPLSVDEADAVQQWKLCRWELPLTYRDELPDAASVEASQQQHLAEEASARALGDASLAATCRAMAERETRMAARIAALPADHYPYRVVVWRMGDVVWVAVPGEPYNLLQRSLRKRFPELALIVCTLAGGWGPSYLPPTECYGQGIYQETIAVLQPGSLEQVIKEVGDRIESLA